MSSSHIWLIERVLKKTLLGIVLVVAVALAVEEITYFGTQPQQWDWLKITGFAACLFAIYVALRLPDKVDVTLQRLHRTKVIEGPLSLDELRDVVHRKAKHAALIGVVTLPLVLTVAFFVALDGDLAAKAPLLAEEVVAAVIVGIFIGRACSYGRLGSRLRQLKFVIKPDPGHLDGAAGLRPVGNLYFYQATLLAIPAVYLAAWWVLIPLVNSRYMIWRDPYVGLLAFVVACEILAFVVPMLMFHRAMLDRQRELFDEADRLSDKIATAARHERTTGEPQEAVDVAAALARYQAIEKMPTWPVDMRLRRRFGIRNVVLLAPVAAEMLGADQSTQDLLERLQKILSGAG